MQHVGTCVKIMWLVAREYAHYCWSGDYAQYVDNILLGLKSKVVLFTKIYQCLTNKEELLNNQVLYDGMKRYTSFATYTEDEINTECLDTIESTYGIIIDRRVIHSGMIALVYKGVMDGRDIIVKIKRKGIVAKLIYSCEFIKAVYRVWPIANNIYLILQPFVENIDDIIEQCDFGNEIRNLEIAKRDLGPLTFIHVPTPFNRDEHRQADTDFILMEYLAGDEMPVLTEENKLIYFERFIELILYTHLNNIIYHADLHPGNLLYMSNGSFGLIDYGMAIHPSPVLQKISYSLITLLYTTADSVNLDETLADVSFVEEFKELVIPPLDIETLERAGLVDKVETILRNISYPLFKQFMIKKRMIN